VSRWSLTREGTFHSSFIGRTHSFALSFRVGRPALYVIHLVVIQNLRPPQQGSEQVGTSLVVSHYESLLTADERSSRITQVPLRQSTP